LFCPPGSRSPGSIEWTHQELLWSSTSLLRLFDILIWYLLFCCQNDVLRSSHHWSLFSIRVIKACDLHGSDILDNNETICVYQWWFAPAFLLWQSDIQYQIYPVELFPEKLMGAIQVCIYSLLVWSKMVASAKVFAVYQLFSVLPLIKYLRFLLSGWAQHKTLFLPFDVSWNFLPCCLIWFCYIMQCASLACVSFLCIWTFPMSSYMED